MGHVIAAEVLESGPDTDAPPPGTVVTSVPALISQTGVAPIVYSNSIIGGYAERMLLSAPLLLPVPNGLDPRHAALTEPMAVGLHAVNKSAIHPCRIRARGRMRADRHGDHRRAAAARRRTCCRADFSETRRRLAQTMGAHQTVDPAQRSPFEVAAPAVVFEGVGPPGVLNDVMRRAPARTRVMVAGVCMEPDTVMPFYDAPKELTIQFVSPTTRASPRTRRGTSPKARSTSPR